MLLMTSDNMTLSQWLRERIRASNMNNKGLAALMGVSPSVVGNWINKGVIPEPENLSKIASVFNADEDWLFGLVGYIKGAKPSPLPSDIEQAVQLLRAMPDADREAILRIVERMAQR